MDVLRFGDGSVLLCFYMLCGCGAGAMMLQLCNMLACCYIGMVNCFCLGALQ